MRSSLLSRLSFPGRMVLSLTGRYICLYFSIYFATKIAE